MRKIAFLFLVVFFLIIFWHLAKNIDREALVNTFTSLFEKRSLVVPLPKQDPQRDLENLLREKKIDIDSSPIASDSALLVTLSDNKTLVLFASNKDLLLQVSTLQIILNRLTIEGRKGTRIDLRFENPIVVY